LRQENESETRQICRAFHFTLVEKRTRNKDIRRGTMQREYFAAKSYAPLFHNIVVLYGCVSFGGIAYRAKTTLKDLKYPGQPTKAYSYEISSIEVLAGNCRVETRPNAIASMSVNILLNGVRDVNGALLLR
jgi:hypothetical protein